LLSRVGTPKITDFGLAKRTDLKLGDPHRAAADADRAVQGEAKEPRLWLGAARVYAQIDAQLRAGRGREGGLPGSPSPHRLRAVRLLLKAVSLVPRRPVAGVLAGERDGGRGPGPDPPHPRV
jgi:hypothetical protein